MEKGETKEESCWGNTVHLVREDPHAISPASSKNKSSVLCYPRLIVQAFYYISGIARGIIS